MTDHAPLAPSSAEKWVHCGRSPSMEAAYPQEDTDETREGTAAHWVLAELLHGRVVEVGTLDPDGTPVDRDMVLAAEELAAHIPAGVQIEQRLHMTTGVHPDNWGTCDAYWVDHPNRTIYVWDYKYGHGFVSEICNWQMIDYAQGVVEAEGIQPGAYSVVMTIYQPRYYGTEGQLRTARYTGYEHQQAVNKLHMAAKLVSPNAAASTGTHCFHCSGRVGCDAFARAVNQIATVVMSTTDAPTPALAGLELRWLHEAQKYLKARVTALEEHVAANPNGTGYVVEQGYGREKWTVEPEEVFALGDAMGLELRKPPEAITPAQAVKLGLDPEVKAGYSYKPKGEVKLVPLDKSRVVAAFIDS